MNTSSSIFVTTDFVAWHRWPGATGERAYLGEYHRHRFGVRVDVSVDHDDREIEFHDLLEDVSVWCVAQDGEYLEHASCEMLANRLLDHLAARYPGARSWWGTITEDNECGAQVYREVEGAGE